MSDITDQQVVEAEVAFAWVEFFDGMRGNRSLDQAKATLEAAIERRALSRACPFCRCRALHPQPCHCENDE